MTETSVRALAANMLVAVLRDGAYLNKSLRQLDSDIRTGRDSALIQELCYGSLRFQPRLEFWLDILLQQPLKQRDLDIHMLLLMGLYQLTEMRIPAHAVINETAEACRTLHKDWAVKLVNAVLRRFQREQAVFQSELSNNSEAFYAHPKWLIEHLQAEWPKDWQSILAANNQRPPLTLRANHRMVTRDALLQEFAAAGITAQPCKFSADGLILATPLQVETLPGFASGKFSVQDEAAQLAADLLDVQSGMRVLDACAAPGGKTCHLLEHYPGVGEVVAVDIDVERNGKIHESLGRLGLSAKVMKADALRPDDWWDRQPFQRILLDAPCSASGVIRRHPDIKAHRRPQDISAAVALQARLLTALWPLLASGGKLLYVTCSIFRMENADQILAFLASQVNAKPLEINNRWGVSAFPGRQILTGQSGMDGFYYACIEKTD
ncbi:MAG TPA: 16S rRNA (cytosine(967)-C(5))-methyltransferase RsmB [Gammaproteobacteria bacterium]|nr:16S rRNA (cytosine(967)-C(5))-methyltransferase RsmB [Gammaproteobacteria bacterium]